MSYDVNSLEAHWMPFSANRDFKKDPRIVVKSEGMYMWDYKGGEIIDGSSALFCTPLGHGDDVGAHIEFLCGKWGSHPAKAGDDLIKNQQ